MKKLKLTVKIILMSLVSLILISSMLLSTMLGSVNALLTKTLSKTFDFEAIPDLPFRYYIKDGNNTSGATGVYKNTKNISQDIKTLPTSHDTHYRIAIPVDESGFYTVTFTADFWRSSDNTAAKLSGTSTYYVTNLDATVGCQILSPKYIDLTAATNFYMSPNNTADNGYAYGVKLKYDDKKLFSAKDHYQWKTLSPSRSETVELSFSVTQADVDNYGYVVWAWDLTGLEANRLHSLKLTNISVKKNQPIDSSRPYFEFMNTQYVNNAILPTDGETKTLNPYNAAGVKNSGFTRYHRARGTFVTNGTYDSLTMQLSPLYLGYNAKVEGGFLTGGSVADKKLTRNYENVVSFSSPIKNIKPDVSYRVTFDFSVANQGTTDYEANASHSSTSTVSGAEGYAIYQNDYNKFFTNDATGQTLHFESYLHRGAADGTSIFYHTDASGRGNVQLSNVGFPGHEVTRYDEILYSISGTPSVNYTSASTDSVTHAQALNKGKTDEVGPGGKIHSGQGINWLNAIRHTELNGDNEIHWLTFYNTSFTFNIDRNYSGVVNGYCENLYWTWAIDALQQTGYFRIKIENVRIEEVEQYGSCLTYESLHINGAKAENFFVNNFATVNANNKTIKNTFRSSSGTGQNYQARGYIASGLSSVPRLAGNNIFGAIYDAGDIKINGSYNIKFSGYCAIKGGIEKYVWSADGGVTWHDATVDTLRAPQTKDEKKRISEYCENFVDQRYNNNVYLDALGETEDPNDANYSKPNTLDPLPTGIKHHFDFVDFVKGVDDVNSVFVGLNADLSEYKYQHNLNVVFAAVPRTNPEARCEILRIINFNPTVNYRTFTSNFKSDIVIGVTGKQLEANWNPSNADNTQDFTRMYGIQVGGSKSSANGYARRTAASHAYEDVRTLYSNMPVKQRLTFTGWAMVQGGTETYLWSADYGKTWNNFKADDLFYGDLTTAVDKDRDTQRKNWYDGKTGTETGVETTATICTNGYFILTVDLSEYIGSVVDIIVAAKPNGSDALCPVARIDNVGVYGDPDATDPALRGMGTFYSKLQTLSINGVELTNHVSQAPDGTFLNGKSQWDDTLSINQYAYTTYEPNNVKLINSRNYNGIYNEVTRGASVTLNGFVVCHGGVAKYKYSFNLGEWNDINLDGQSVSSATEDIMNAATNSTDSSFNMEEDSALADFSINNSLTFNLPENVSGKQELFVVAESTKGYLYPVLRIKLDITDTLTVADKSAKLTFPVTQAGTYSLNYTSYSTLDKPVTHTHSTLGTSISVSKTIYKQGEIVNVEYDAKSRNTTAQDVWLGYGPVDASYESWGYATADKGTYQINTTNLSGSYKIYFIDNNKALADTSAYLADPIIITVLSEDMFEPFKKVSNKGTTHAVTIPKRVFTVGEEIDFSVEYNTAYSSMVPWVCITPYNNDEYPTWSYAEGTDRHNLVTSNVGSGRYNFRYLVGSNAAASNTTQFVSIPIHLLDPNLFENVTISGTVNGTALPSVTQSGFPRGDRVNATVTVTEADVQMGYVEINYSLANISEQTTATLIIKDLSFKKQ